MQRAFLDTKVVFYLLSADEAKANTAEALLTQGGLISVQVLNEAASVCLRKLKLLLCGALPGSARARRLFGRQLIEADDVGLAGPLRG